MPDFQNGLNLFLMLCMGHFVADFGLQSDRMATEKCPGRDVVLGWPWWLVSHAAIHGFFVAWITGIPLVGVAEWLVHILIDYAKCRHLFRISVDQALHILFKLIWTLVILSLGLGNRGLAG
ncbi:DUF3307 domain-containing protein [Aphanothece stagnina]|uniref:DUF3307 domain-containing protein n=2 Tax=Aphanothece TaxID=1121 RepID=UPI00398E9CAF